MYTKKNQIPYTQFSALLVSIIYPGDYCETKGDRIGLTHDKDYVSVSNYYFSIMKNKKQFF